MHLIFILIDFFFRINIYMKNDMWQEYWPLPN